MTTSYEYDDLAFLRRPLVPHDPYPRFLDPPGTALQRATAIFTGGDWARSLTVLPLVELTAEAVPDRGGYLRPPHCRNTVRWHGASDSVSSCRQLPIDTSSGVVWGPSASEGGEAPVKLAALRLARLIPRLLQDDIAEAWYRCRLAGIQNLEPETARGSDPALHCGHWMTVHDHPSLPKESDPSKLSPEAADALVWLLSLLAVAGSLALQALQVADLAAGVRTEEVNAGLYWWYERVCGRPMPDHWRLGIAPSIAIKGGAATGMHLDHHDDRWHPSCVIRIRLGTGYSDLQMHVPQLRLLAPCLPGDAVLFPPRLYRHTNTAGIGLENRLAITYFCTKPVSKWGRRCFDYMTLKQLAIRSPLSPPQRLDPSHFLPAGFVAPHNDSLAVIGPFLPKGTRPNSRAVLRANREAARDPPRDPSPPAKRQRRR